MFVKFARNLFSKIRRVQPRKLITTAAFITFSLYNSSLRLSEDKPVTEQDAIVRENQKIVKDMQEYLKNLQKIDVCSSKQIGEGGRKIVKVKNHRGEEKSIMILRVNNKLYGILGSCPHREPFDDDNTQYSLQNAVVFNDKLYCPHHGCIFDIKSGSTEHGPTLLNLPIFIVDDSTTMIKLIYPKAVPTGIMPDLVAKETEDHRKAVILGGDDNPTIGCINSLRQFAYSGQITVVKQGNFGYPYKKEYLHKSLLNLHMNDKKQQKQISQSNEKVKDNLKRQNTADEYISEQIQNRIYKKLKYYPDEWYEYYGIDFLFTDESYRIINKRFYPYITFSDGSKIQFDALMVSTGLLHKVPSYQSLTVSHQTDINAKLSENVFCPLKSKKQHLRLLTFLNTNIIKNLLVVGYNLQSFEFLEAMTKEFPDIKIKVVDELKQSVISEHLGPQIQKRLAKEFTSRGIQFYVKIKQHLLFSNRFSRENVKIKQLEQLKSKNLVEKEDKNRYYNSVTVRVADDLRFKTDGVVIFPYEFQANTDNIRNGKYTDFDFTNQKKLGGDTFNKTDNMRIFSAGTSSSNDYYLTGNRLNSTNPLVGYEQGYNIGLNMQALRIPFTYVPVEYYTFFNKKLIYTGCRQFYDSILVLGSVQNWDFLTIYANGNQILAVSGSQSKSKEVNIFRQAFRVNCVPMFTDLITGYWTVENLEVLINKLNKSGCYRDLIYQNLQNINHKDLIWMERSPTAGFQNDHPDAQDFPSVEVDETGRLKQL